MPTPTVQVVTLVPAKTAEELRDLAQRSERSVAAELRLALRAWLDDAASREAA